MVFRDGSYHLYVSEMAGHCGLATWGTNSFIRHAVSETVDGILAPRETVLPAWGHNAMPWVTPDGDIAVWHIGNGTRSAGCSNTRRRRITERWLNRGRGGVNARATRQSPSPTRPAYR